VTRTDSDFAKETIMSYIEQNLARSRMLSLQADAEAIYSYEGTREVNSLIVGRAVTGTSAIV